MSVKVQRLRALVNERLTAAAEEIFALFERTIVEYEEEMCRSEEENKRKQQLLDSVLKPQVLLHRADAQIQVASINIKEEQQNYISLQNVHSPESACTAEQRQTEENREETEAEDIGSTEPQGHLGSETERQAESDDVWEPPCSSSDQQKATEAYTDNDQVRKEHSDKPAAAQNSSLFTKSMKTGKKRSRGTILGERRCNIMHDCEVCGDKFRGNGGNLRQHMLVHKRERPFSCSVCKTGFTLEDQLEGHMETHRDNDKEESVLLQQKQNEEDRQRTEGEDCGGAETGMSLDSNTSGPEREAEKTENKEPDEQMETEADGDDCSQVHKEESDKPTAAQNSGLFRKSKSKEKNCVQICNVMHECEVCGDKVRGNSGNFQRHMLVHKRERPFSCSVCKKRFTLEAQLEEHVETHRDNDKEESVLLQQKQTEENREDTEGEDMNNGISAGKKVNQCSVCVKTFTTKARLNRHMSVHTGEKPYNCPVCKKSFAQKYNLQTHMPVHTGEKPFSCSVCQKSYRRKDDLRTHMSTHTGEVLFSCLVCNAGFRQRNSLRTHMRIHTGDRPFGCSLCSKSFVQKSNLNRHMAVHTGEKPFGCPVCPQRFIQKSDVYKHMMVHP